MNTQPVEKKFDPTQAGPINITATGNGWCLWVWSTDRAQRDYGSCCIQSPSYVFNSAAELGLAIANLAQFGTITRPEPPPVYHVT